MKIAVLGATGTAGSRAASRIKGRGVAVVAICIGVGQGMAVVLER